MLLVAGWWRYSRRCGGCFGMGIAKRLFSSSLDLEYVLDAKNFDEILKNVRLRKLDVLAKQLADCGGQEEEVRRVIAENVSRLPNRLHPKWHEIDAERVDEKAEIAAQEVVGKMATFDFVSKPAEVLLQKLKLLMLNTDRNLGHLAGNRSYVLLGDLARLERALTNWTMKQLVRKFNFTPVIVPNLLYEDVVEKCGFSTKSVRSQVYTIDGRIGVNWKELRKEQRDFQMNSVCLSGTSEIPLVALHMGKRFDAYSEDKSEQLPKRFCALSRCYRAETSTLEPGLYRIHYFNKVEMLALTRQEDAQRTLLEFVDIQKNLFSQLAMHFRILDMPPHELGLSAYRKLDIEAHFPGRGVWGEISSASDCTDFQSRRFNITYRYLSPNYESNEPFQQQFVSTVNGTACASPRILLPLVEANQDEHGQVRIPNVLRGEMGGQEFLNKLSFG